MACLLVPGNVSGRDVFFSVVETQLKNEVEEISKSKHEMLKNFVDILNILTTPSAFGCHPSKEGNFDLNCLKNLIIIPPSEGGHYNINYAAAGGVAKTIY